MTFFAGLDLGQTTDYTALVIGEMPEINLPSASEQHEDAVQQFLTAGTPWERPAPAAAPIDSEQLPLLVRYARRLPLKVSYPDIVRHVKALFIRPELSENAVLGIDGTGVGAAVVDLFHEADMPCEIIPVYITGGATVSEKTNTLGGPLGYNVPKRDLAATLQVRLQNKLLKIAAGVEDAKTLERELLNFRVKINTKTAHDTYEAWREGDHDDLVLAAAIACWVAALRGGGPQLRAVG